MSRLTLRFALIATVAASASAQAQQPSWTPPAPAERCPSKWGANDERGSMNHMKPAAVMAKKVYEFAFIMQPMKMQGATGSTVAPVAVR